MPARPLATLSLDLDDEWTYLKVQGDPRWESRPSYLAIFIPIVRAALRDLDLRLTVFVVGADAARPENAALLRGLAEDGHEIGNHSHEHESWLHEYSVEQLSAELDRSEAAIIAATGCRPVGFRGPGYSWSPALLELLAARGYRYDASTLPTFIGPLARWYYFRAAKLSAEARNTRRLLFGRFADGFRPLAPHRLQLRSGAALLEIPVTTMPVTRAPFHPSYLIYLARRSPALARGYFRTALSLCRATGTPPSLLLHPLDFLGGDDVAGLRFFPGMDLPGAQKRAFVRETLVRLRDGFDVQTLGAFASRLDATALKTRVIGAR